MGTKNQQTKPKKCPQKGSERRKKKCKQKHSSIQYGQIARSLFYNFNNNMVDRNHATVHSDFLFGNCVIRLLPM